MKQYQAALPLVEKNKIKLDDVDVLQAVKQIVSILNDVEEKIIYNCQEKPGLIVSESNNSTSIILDKRINLMNIEV